MYLKNYVTNIRREPKAYLFKYVPLNKSPLYGKVETIWHFTQFYERENENETLVERKGRVVVVATVTCVKSKRTYTHT